MKLKTKKKIDAALSDSIEKICKLSHNFKCDDSNINRKYI